MSDAHASGVGSDEAKREAARYLDQIEKIEEATANAPRPKRRHRRSLGPVLFTSFPVFIALTTWNIMRALDEPLVFTPNEERAEALLTVLEAADAIDGYHDSAGTFPRTLDSTDVDTESLQYSVAGRTYQLATTTSPRIEYASWEPIERLEAELDTLVHAEGQ
jgi:hypothetical protein